MVMGDEAVSWITIAQVGGDGGTFQSCLMAGAQGVVCGRVCLGTCVYGTGMIERWHAATHTRAEQPSALAVWWTVPVLGAGLTGGGGVLE